MPEPLPSLSVPATYSRSPPSTALPGYPLTRMPSPAGRFFRSGSPRAWLGNTAASVGSSFTAAGPARRKRKTRSALPPLANTSPDGVAATPMNRLAAAVGTAVRLAVSMVVRLCGPPLSELTSTVDWSGVAAIPSGKRSTSIDVPPGRMRQPCGVRSPSTAAAGPSSASAAAPPFANLALALDPLAAPVRSRKRCALRPSAGPASCARRDATRAVADVPVATRPAATRAAVSRRGR